MSENEKQYLPNYKRENFENWKGNWELICGIPYALVYEPELPYNTDEAPGITHRILIENIIAQINNSLLQIISSECKASMNVKWQIEDSIIVKPDVAVFCNPEYDKDFLLTKPEIIFEIQSPKTAEKDRHLKHDLYEYYNVPYYIISDPVAKFAEIFILNPDKKYKSKGIFKTETFHFDISGCSFDLDFGRIW